MQFFATVPDNSTIQFQQNGCYGQDGSIQLVDRNGLTIDGNGSTIEALTQGDRSRANWIFQGGTNVTIENMTIDGVDTQYNPGTTDVAAYLTSLYEWQAGMSFESTQGATVENVTTNDIGGDTVMTNPDPRYNTTINGVYQAWPVRNLLIENSHFNSNGREGIGLYDTDGAVIQNNYIGGSGQALIDIEPDAAAESASNIKILNNTIGSHQHSVVANWGYATEANDSHIVISGNKDIGTLITCQPAVTVGHDDANDGFKHDFTITGNQFHSYSNGVELTGVEGASISGNTIRWVPGGGCGSANVGADLSQSENITINNNSFPSMAGVYQADSLSTGIQLLGTNTL